MPLVSTVLKYVDTGSKSSIILDPVVKRWLRIALHILSKNIAIAIGFIIGVLVLKVEVVS